MTPRRSPVLTTLLAATAMLGGGLPPGLLDAPREPKPRDEAATAAAEAKRARKRRAWRLATGAPTCRCGGLSGERCPADPSRWSADDCMAQFGTTKEPF